jgi:hypothetical protein
LGEHPREVQVETIRVRAADAVEVVYRQPPGGELRGIRVSATDIVPGVGGTSGYTVPELAFLVAHVGILEPRPADDFGTPDPGGISWLRSHDWLLPMTADPAARPTPRLPWVSARGSDGFVRGHPVRGMVVLGLLGGPLCGLAVGVVDVVVTLATGMAGDPVAWVYVFLLLILAGMAVGCWSLVFALAGYWSGRKLGGSTLRPACAAVSATAGVALLAWLWLMSAEQVDSATLLIWASVSVLAGAAYFLVARIGLNAGTSSRSGGHER